MLNPTPAIDAKDETRPTNAAFLVILILTAFRCLTLIRSPLNLQFDEAQYWGWAQHLAFGYVSKPPLIAWIIALTTHLMGNGEAAVRMASPVIQGLTALTIFAVTSRLYNRWTGYWIAVAFATLPGISFSSLLITTDVPLLLFWSLALLAWLQLIERPSPRYALLLGLWLGLGLLSKYAMAYFVLGMVCHYAASPALRKTLPLRYVGVAILVVLLLIAPNLTWNLRNGLATFMHTADNADWSNPKGGITHLFTFWAAQIGIFGPIFSVGLVLALWRFRSSFGEAETTLACFSVPVLAIVSIQALIAGAHANWAAPAYIAATILAGAFLIENARWALIVSVWGQFILTLALCLVFSGSIPLPHRYDPFAKLKGWDQLAHLVDQKMLNHPGWSILTDERKHAVVLNYYLRDRPYPITIWPFQGRKHSQFALTNSIDETTGQHAILVTRWPEPAIEHNFSSSHLSDVFTFTPSMGDTRRFYVFECEGLKDVP